MWKRTKTFADWQTPEQRKVQAAIWREADAAKLAQCNSLAFWRKCGERACKRRHTCAGDPYACFDRQWARYPEEAKIAIRAFIKARVAGLSFDQAIIAAADEVERFEELVAKFSPHAGAAVQPPSQDVADHDGAAIVPRDRGPRVRGL